MIKLFRSDLSEPPSAPAAFTRLSVPTETDFYCLSSAGGWKLRGWDTPPADQPIPDCTHINDKQIFRFKQLLHLQQSCFILVHSFTLCVYIIYVDIYIIYTHAALHCFPLLVWSWAAFRCLSTLTNNSKVEFKLIKVLLTFSFYVRKIKTKLWNKKNKK